MVVSCHFLDETCGLYMTIKSVPRNAGSTELLRAAERGYFRRLRNLLANGADVNVRDDKFGATPLMWAAEEGHDLCLRPLIAAGADVNARDNNGETPLTCAAAGGHSQCVWILLGAGADPHLKDNDGRDALEHAKRFAAEWRDWDGRGAGCVTLLEKAFEHEKGDVHSRVYRHQVGRPSAHQL